MNMKKFLLAAAAALSFTVLPVCAQEITGHIGFLLPLATREAGQNTTLLDQLAYGFPVGITVKREGPLALDFEVAPEIETSPLKIHATIHPGLVLSLPFRFEAGLSAAYTPGSDAKYGFTPIIGRTWRLPREFFLFREYFVEAEIPVRFRRPAVGPDTIPVAFALHTGWVLALREK